MNTSKAHYMIFHGAILKPTVYVLIKQDKIAFMKTHNFSEL